MPVVTIRPGQLGAVIKRDAKAYRTSIEQGVRLAAQRVVSYLKTISPVYDGAFRAAWTVLKDPSGMAQVSNSAPHAGIIEAGARPHGVNAEGREAIREWVRKVITRLSVPEGGIAPHTNENRHFKGRGSRALTKKEAEGPFAWWVDSITEAIIRRLRLKGQKGRFIVRDNLDKFVRWTGDEINKRIALYVSKVGAP